MSSSTVLCVFDAFKAESEFDHSECECMRAYKIGFRSANVQKTNEQISVGFCYFHSMLTSIRTALCILIRIASCFSELFEHCC